MLLARNHRLTVSTLMVAVNQTSFHFIPSHNTSSLAKIEFPVYCFKWLNIYLFFFPIKFFSAFILQLYFLSIKNSFFFDVFFHRWKFWAPARLTSFHSTFVSKVFQPQTHYLLIRKWSLGTNQTLTNRSGFIPTYKTSNMHSHICTFMDIWIKQWNVRGAVYMHCRIYPTSVSNKNTFLSIDPIDACEVIGKAPFSRLLYDWLPSIMSTFSKSNNNTYRSIFLEISLYDGAKRQRNFWKNAEKSQKKNSEKIERFFQKYQMERIFFT